MTELVTVRGPFLCRDHGSLLEHGSEGNGLASHRVCCATANPHPPIRERSPIFNAPSAAVHRGSSRDRRGRQCDWPRLSASLGRRRFHRHGRVPRQPPRHPSFALVMRPSSSAANAAPSAPHVPRRPLRERSRTTSARGRACRARARCSTRRSCQSPDPLHGRLQRSCLLPPSLLLPSYHQIQDSFAFQLAFSHGHMHVQ
jgi:hypothetical protein